METNGNMHHPNNNIWCRMQYNNAKKPENTNNHEQHNKNNSPSTTINTKKNITVETIETGILNIQTLTEIKQLNNHMRINKMDQDGDIKQT